MYYVDIRGAGTFPLRSRSLVDLIIEAEEVIRDGNRGKVKSISWVDYSIEKRRAGRRKVVYRGSVVLSPPDR